jgi:hypothetical protein
MMKDSSHELYRLKHVFRYVSHTHTHTHYTDPTKLTDYLTHIQNARSNAQIISKWSQINV